ncbi:MAG: type IV pilus secretin PilQ [Gammaproteobacteria bacterium]|nr:type IV pilus secretin PilQ [Gammaproteobacteria bacterium]
MNLLHIAVLLIALPVLQLSATDTQAAEGNVLNAVDYVTLPGGKVQLRLGFDKPVSEDPSSFSIEQPPRLSVDFAATSMALAKKMLQFDAGVLNSVRVVQANDRTRVVVNMKAMVPYEIRTEANLVFINFASQEQQVQQAALAIATGKASNSIPEIDFRRGAVGEGKITFALSDANTIINMEEKGNKIIIDFVNAQLPEKLVRRLDVTDFATPISTIDAFNVGQGARIVVDSTGNFEHMAYQAGKEFIIAIKPLSAEEVTEKQKDKFGYSGQKLSLNFQNIEVRAVLQLIADFTDKNVVASDTVQGNITLRLKNVPWDQALDIILRTRGLGMRESGNVILIAPNAEIAAREKEELEAQKQMIDLAPVQTRYHQINYAKAADIAGLLKGEKNSILTERGSVTIDERTNTLMVLETSTKHEEVAALIQKLDIPVRQVMIESRIVIANDDFGRDLGIRTGVTGVTDNGTNGIIAATGSTAGTDTMVSSAIANNLAGTGPYPVEMPALENRYNVNLPVSGAGSLALAILGSDYLVDLELSALQTEGRGEVLSNPRVITSNQKVARIEQGVEIPYQEAASSGATSVSFKKAVLSLEVTPQITPDDRVVMDLSVNKDSVGGIYSGVPSINTRSITTQVLVNNGDTVVLGGVYEQSTSEGNTKVPLLGDIPILGALFRSTSRKESKAELLIFVTPKILNDKLNTGL